MENILHEIQMDINNAADAFDRGNAIESHYLRAQATNLALLSIATSLQRIAASLEGFSDNSEANDALRVNVLR